MTVIVNQFGMLNSVRVTSSPDPAFALAAIECVKDWEFKPATLDGKPVAVALKIDVVFRAY